MDSAILSTPMLCAGDFVSDPTSSLPSGRYVVVLEIVNLPEHQGVFPLIVYELGGWPSSRGLFLWMEGGLGTLIFSSAHRSWHALVIYMKRVDISRQRGECLVFSPSLPGWRSRNTYEHSWEAVRELLPPEKRSCPPGHHSLICPG